MWWESVAHAGRAATGDRTRDRLPDRGAVVRGLWGRGKHVYTQTYTCRYEEPRDHRGGLRATESTRARGDADEPFFAPSLALFEVYRGAARAGGTDQVDRAASVLDWVEVLAPDDSTAREAAPIGADLLERGDRIDLGDVLVAGVCRHHGASLVTRNGRFGRVDGPDVERY